MLYLLSVGNVRGFAFTLGLTTLVDMLVAFSFTRPVVALLAKTRFFQSGHKLESASTPSAWASHRARPPRPAVTAAEAVV